VPGGSRRSPALVGSSMSGARGSAKVAANPLARARHYTALVRRVGVRDGHARPR
jgi:hypothetical protein